jgi:hypothetical protein
MALLLWHLMKCSYMLVLALVRAMEQCQHPGLHNHHLDTPAADTER